MTKVMQTKHGKVGNCFQACVASVLELPLEQVPDFCNVYNDHNWFIEVQKWCFRLGFSAVCANVDCDILHTIDIAPGYMIASGMSLRGLKHSVIVKNGLGMHDPHPTNKFITKVEDLIIFFPLDPKELL